MKRTIFVLLICLMFPAVASAGIGEWQWAGVRVETFETGQKNDFTQYEVWAFKHLRWQWTLGERWHVQSAIEASVGSIQGAGVEALFAAVGPMVILRRGDSPWSFDIGSRPTYISEHQFGQDGFGGPFQFTSSGSVNRDFGHWTVGYRFHHMSNARIYDENDGINFHFIQIGRRCGK